MIFILSAFAGFYHPSDVAASSASFQAAAEVNSKVARSAQADARAYATALRQYETALDLLGAVEPTEQRARLEALQRDYNRRFASLQAHADDTVGRFDAAFGAALQRALAAHPGAVRCQGTIPDGPKLPGMRQRTKANPECTGDDLNHALAAALDRDATLTADLKVLASTPWPSVALDAEPVDAGGNRWVDVYSLMSSGLGPTLANIDRADESARLDFEVAIENGAAVNELEGMVSKAREIDAQTRAKRASLAAPVIERASRVFEKRGGGWCAQPALLGGCNGESSADLREALLSDKKLAKALGL